MRFALDGTYCQNEVTGLTRYSRSLLSNMDLIWDQSTHNEQATVFGFRGGGVIALNFKRFKKVQVWGNVRLHLYLTGLFGEPNIARAFRRRGVGVVHFHDIFRFGGDVKGIRSFVTLHDLASLSTDFYSKRASWLKRSALQRLIRSEAIVLTISDFTRNELLCNTTINPARVRTVHLGVDDMFHYRDDSESRNNEEELSILYVGSGHPRKNLTCVLEVFGRLRTSFPPKLVLVGPGIYSHLKTLPAFERLPSSVRERIIIKGYVPDVELVGLYRKSGCLLFPSYHEGFGLPVLEAMNSGCPVVCSDRGALPEVVGEASIIINPDDYNATARSVEAVLEDTSLRNELRMAGFKRASSFKWEHTARKTIEAFLEDY